MLQQDQPEDFVISTEETYSVRKFCQIAFDHVGLDWEKYVVVDPKFYRPAEVELLLGDCTKARTKLGWERDYSFKDLIVAMVDGDMARQQARMDQAK